MSVGRAGSRDGPARDVEGGDVRTVARQGHSDRGRDRTDVEPARIIGCVAKAIRVYGRDTYITLRCARQIHGSREDVVHARKSGVHDAAEHDIAAALAASASNCHIRFVRQIYPRASCRVSEAEAECRTRFGIVRSRVRRIAAVVDRIDIKIQRSIGQRM